MKPRKRKQVRESDQVGDEMNDSNDSGKLIIDMATTEEGDVQTKTSIFGGISSEEKENCLPTETELPSEEASCGERAVEGNQDVEWQADKAQDGHKRKRNKQELSPNQKRQRTNFSREQTELLEKVFMEIPHPDETVLKSMESTVGLAEKVIQVWFQNRRARLKKDTNNIHRYPGNVAHPEIPQAFQYSDNGASTAASSQNPWNLNPSAHFPPSHPAIPDNTHVDQDATPYQQYGDMHRDTQMKTEEHQDPRKPDIDTDTASQDSTAVSAIVTWRNAVNEAYGLSVSNSEFPYTGTEQQHQYSTQKQPDGETTTLDKDHNVNPEGNSHPGLDPQQQQMIQHANPSHMMGNMYGHIPGQQMQDEYAFNMQRQMAMGQYQMFQQQQMYNMSSHDEQHNPQTTPTSAQPHVPEGVNDPAAENLYTTVDHAAFSALTKHEDQPELGKQVPDTTTRSSAKPGKSSRKREKQARQTSASTSRKDKDKAVARDQGKSEHARMATNTNIPIAPAPEENRGINNDMPKEGHHPSINDASGAISTQTDVMNAQAAAMYTHPVTLNTHEAMKTHAVTMNTYPAEIPGYPTRTFEPPGHPHGTSNVMDIRPSIPIEHCLPHIRKNETPTSDQQSTLNAGAYNRQHADPTKQELENIGNPHQWAMWNMPPETTNTQPKDPPFGESAKQNSHPRHPNKLMAASISGSIPSHPHRSPNYPVSNSKGAPTFPEIPGKEMPSGNCRDPDFARERNKPNVGYFPGNHKIHDKNRRPEEDESHISNPNDIKGKASSDDIKRQTSESLKSRDSSFFQHTAYSHAPVNAKQPHTSTHWGQVATDELEKQSQVHNSPPKVSLTIDQRSQDMYPHQCASYDLDARSYQDLASHGVDGNRESFVHRTGPMFLDIPKSTQAKDHHEITQYRSHHNMPDSNDLTVIPSTTDARKNSSPTSQKTGLAAHAPQYTTGYDSASKRDDSATKTEPVTTTTPVIPTAFNSSQHGAFAAFGVLPHPGGFTKMKPPSFGVPKTEESEGKSFLGPSSENQIINPVPRLPIGHSPFDRHSASAFKSSKQSAFEPRTKVTEAKNEENCTDKEYTKSHQHSKSNDSVSDNKKMLFGHHENGSSSRIQPVNRVDKKEDLSKQQWLRTSGDSQGTVQTASGIRQPSPRIPLVPSYASDENRHSPTQSHVAHGDNGASPSKRPDAASNYLPWQHAFAHPHAMQMAAAREQMMWQQAQANAMHLTPEARYMMGMGGMMPDKNSPHMLQLPSTNPMMLSHAGGADSASQSALQRLHALKMMATGAGNEGEPLDQRRSGPSAEPSPVGTPKSDAGHKKANAGKDTSSGKGSPISSADTLSMRDRTSPYANQEGLLHPVIPGYPGAAQMSPAHMSLLNAHRAMGAASASPGHLYGHPSAMTDPYRHHALQLQPMSMPGMMIPGAGLPPHGMPGMYPQPFASSPQLMLHQNPFAMQEMAARGMSPWLPGMPQFSGLPARNPPH